MLFTYLLYSQEYSDTYIKFRDSSNLSITQKERLIDSLFKVHVSQGEKTILANELYNFARWHNKNTTIEKALKYNFKCDSLIKTIDSFDTYLHQRVVNNTGYYYAKKGDCYNAFKAYKRLTTIGEISAFRVKAYQRAGRHLGHLGDFYKASEYFEKSIIEAKKLDDPTIFIVNSIDAGINYRRIGTKKSFDRGIKILKGAISYIEEKNKKTNGKISASLEFFVYNHLGNLYNDRKDYDFDNSKKYYDKALSLALKVKDSNMLSLVYNDQGHLYLHNTNPKALNLFKTASNYALDKIMESIIYENIGRYYYKNKDFNIALENIQKSLNIILPHANNNFQKLPNKEYIYASQHKTDLLRLLILKGDIWLGFYKEVDEKEYLKNALETYELADYLIDIIRLETDERESKLFWRKTVSNVYSNAVETCLYLNNQNKAFYFMEKSKALLLLEDVSLRKLKESYNFQPDVNDRELLLKSDILKYSVELPKSINKDSVRNLLFDAKNKYQKFIDSIEKKYNINYNLKEVVKPLNLNQIKLGLKSDEAYIEYILGSNKGYGVFIDKNSTQFFEINNYKDLLKNSQEFRKLIEAPFATQKQENDFNNISNAIYKSLFPKSILSKIKNKKITLIPDSYLQNVPFEALVTDKNEKSYLIESNEISYAYSISFLDRNKHDKANKENVFLGFAPVNFSNLPSLPKSEEEINSSANLFKSDVFLNNKASKKQFLNNITEYNIVHLASHAEADDLSSPRIVFSDEDIDLEELYLTKNSASLVVLSACKTSMGELIEGEGVMSLARGFMATGAESVVSTLWNINDDASSEIIIDFYKNIKQGKSKSFALREAKLNYLKTHKLSERSPYYWSSFVLIGDANEILLGNDINSITLLLVGLLIGVILLIIYLKFKK